MASYRGSIRVLRADNDFFGAADLIPDDASDVGKEKADWCFRIVDIDYSESRKVGGTSKKNVLALKLAMPDGRACKKEWILNKTNANIIATMYGALTEKWIGKWVWLYVDPRCRNPSGGEIAGIRVRVGKTQPPQQQQPKQEGGAT